MRDWRRAHLRLLQGGKKPYHPDNALAARFRIAAIVLWLIVGLVTWVREPNLMNTMMLAGTVCFGLAMLLEK